MRIIKTTTEYIDKDPWQTAEEMEDRCCVPTPEIVCKKTVESWSGYSASDVLDDLNIQVDENGRDARGHKVRVEFLARKNPCGKQITEYDDEKKNCCNEALPIAVDTEISVTVLADSSQGTVYFYGGRSDIHASIRGTGFYLDKGRSIRDANYENNIAQREDDPLHLVEKDITVVGIPVYTNEDSCGMAKLTISDGCSSDEYMIKAADGQWIEITNQVDPNTCLVEGLGTWAPELGTLQGNIWGFESGEYAYTVSSYPGYERATACWAGGNYVQAYCSDRYGNPLPDPEPGCPGNLDVGYNICFSAMQPVTAEDDAPYSFTKRGNKGVFWGSTDCADDIAKNIWVFLADTQRWFRWEC